MCIPGTPLQLRFQLHLRIGKAGPGPFSERHDPVANKGRSLSRTAPDTWRIIGYVRDVIVILGILFGAMYLYEHPEKFDAFLYWAIGHYYRH
jgi:hypothetical protein